MFWNAFKANYLKIRGIVDAYVVPFETPAYDVLLQDNFCESSEDITDKIYNYQTDSQQTIAQAFSEQVDIQLTDVKFEEEKHLISEYIYHSFVYDKLVDYCNEELILQSEFKIQIKVVLLMGMLSS